MTHLVILVLQLGLSAFGSRTNGLGIIPVKGATRLGMEQLGSVLVVAGDEEGNAKGATHDGLLAVSTFAEAQGKVADGLSAALDTKGLVVVEGVRLALDTGVLDHGAGVGLETGHGATDVAVDLDNLLNRRRLEEGRGYALLDAEDYALRGGDADGRGAELDGLKGVFDLEETALWGEGVDTSVCGQGAKRLALGDWRGRGAIGGMGACRILILP